LVLVTGNFEIAGDLIEIAGDLVEIAGGNFEIAGGNFGSFVLIRSL
jgi:hypothetical protein